MKKINTNFKNAELQTNLSARSKSKSYNNIIRYYKNLENKKVNKQFVNANSYFEFSFDDMF
jgi:hypothetical protein